MIQPKYQIGDYVIANGGYYEYKGMVDGVYLNHEVGDYKGLTNPRYSYSIWTEEKEFIVGTGSTKIVTRICRHEDVEENIKMDTMKMMKEYGK